MLLLATLVLFLVGLQRRIANDQMILARTSEFRHEAKKEVIFCCFVRAPTVMRAFHVPTCVFADEALKFPPPGRQSRPRARQFCDSAAWLRQQK